MKKTFTINLAGFGFVIDDDAYEMLQSYLTTLTEICDKTGEKEIATDIEQRISEIFADKFMKAGSGIITRIDVEEVINRMGTPEEIVCFEESAGESSQEAAAESEATPPPFPGPCPPPVMNMPIQKRLYRDLRNRVLGGVCSGLGWFFGIDPSWIRILTVVAAILSGTTIGFVYLILWICIPAANTPFKRMQMMGVDPSMKNVGRVVTDEFGPYAGIAPQTTQSDTAGSVLKAVLVAILMMGVFAFFTIPGTTRLRLILGCVFGGILLLALPIVLLVRLLQRKRTLQAVTSAGTSAVIQTPAAMNLLLVLLWFISLGTVISCGYLLSSP